MAARSTAIISFTGSRQLVYLHLALHAAWILANLGIVPGVPKFDPSFVILAMEASVEAIFLSTFVLISQNARALHRTSAPTSTCTSICWPNTN